MRDMRIVAAVILTNVLGQSDESLSANLKQDGWKAVAAIVEKGESARPALQSSAASKDPDTSFFANAALAELDAAREGAQALLVSERPSPDSKNPAFVFGRFHTWLEQRYRVDFNQFDPGPASYVQFSGRIVPKGPIVSKRLKVEVLEALDDRGNRLRVPEKRLDHLEQAERNRPGVWYSFAVDAPADARSLDRIRLRIEVACERRRGEIIFDDLTGGQEKKSGAVSVKLVSFLPSSANEYQVTIEAKADSGHPWLEHTKIALRGAHGMEWRQRGAHIRHNADGMYYQFHYGDPGGGAGAPKTLRFPAVTETYLRTWFVEFREVPLQ